MSNRHFSQPHPLSYLKTVLYIPRLTVIVPLLILTSGPIPGLAEESCSELLTNRCEVCHYNTRVCQKVQRKKGKSSWKRTVKNMVKQGAKLDKAEQKKLVDCLSKPTPEILEFCNIKK